MNTKTASPQLNRSYLLGELDADTRQQLEEALMVNEEYYQELLIAEDELIDRYLNGGLDARERERFLKHFLITPGRRQKLDFARTFHTYVTNQTPQPSAVESDSGEQPGGWARLFPFLAGGYSAALRLTFATALLLMLLAGSWVFFKRWQQPAPSLRDDRNVLAVSLAPVLTRSAGESKTINITSGVTIVQLRLEPTMAGQESYSARLLTDERDEIYNAKALTAGGDGAVVVELPAELLRVGDYRLKLEGSKGGATEGAGTYYFRVARE